MVADSVVMGLLDRLGGFLLGAIAARGGVGARCLRQFFFNAASFVYLVPLLKLAYQ
jgi:hypothetical protein